VTTPQSLFQDTVKLLRFSHSLILRISRLWQIQEEAGREY